MLKDFAGATAVITGAGSGFGREFALIGAHRKMKLVLADVQADALAQTSEMVATAGATEVISQVTDVSQFESMQSLADRCHEQFGPASLLFNNAGVAAGGLLWENEPADWAWVLGVNLVGVANGVHAFVPAMVAAGKAAHVINTASVAGLVSPPTLGIYNVSKHGVVALSETLYHDFRLVKAPIGVSVLCPAFVPTGIAASERNRPQDMRSKQPPTASMQAAQQATAKAVGAGKISAADVAQATFKAIEDDRFYIVTHGKIMDSVRTRAEDVALLRNPTDPYARKQDVTPEL
ncbi:MAG: SDR family oxidoreductase [Burkholderiaceae bacterium]